MPPVKRAKYRTIASAKLARGPAATMTKRFPTGCRLKARGSSAGSMGLSRSGSTSRSSSMRTYPPSGIAATVHSVRSGPRDVQRSSGRPKPIEKRSTLTPQARAAR